MFYHVFGVPINNRTEWTGYIFIRKNETLKEGILRHFPKYDMSDFCYSLKCNDMTFLDMLLSDYKDFLKWVEGD